MKLSEAIRLGAMLKPQGFGALRLNGTTACANDAAALAIGARSWGDLAYDGRWEAAFPLAMIPCTKENICCPDCRELRTGGLDRVVGGVIAHLNDTHRWTRERIADWVATIEAQQESAALSNPSTVEVSAANELVVK